MREEYAEKLRDPRWQKKRLEILNRDEWKCKYCKEKEKTLHVHHIFYFPNKDPWEIHNGFLITLCEDCHSLPKDLDEDCNTRESIINEIGGLLDSIWHCNYDYFDLTDLSWKIYKAGKIPNTTPDNYNINLSIEKIKL